MKEEQFLVDVGLTKTEAKVYLALLRTGPSSIRKVANATKINRGTTYEAIKNLLNQVMVSYKVVGKRSHYTAESPEQISHLIAAKKQSTEQLEAQAKEILPNLTGYIYHSADAPKVRFYEDDEGVATILLDVINTVAQLDDKHYCVYSSRSLRQYLYRRFPNFTKRRVKEGIFVKAIAIGTGGDPLQLAERKFLDESDSEISSSYSLIYGNKVAMISVSKDLTPYGVVIEDDGVAAMQRHLFEQLWKNL